MALYNTVCILDYLEYDQPVDFILKREEMLVARRNHRLLLILKELGVKLVFDGKKTQGLYITDKHGTILGHVTVWMNDTWKSELVNDLVELANDPEAYDLK